MKKEVKRRTNTNRTTSSRTTRSSKTSKKNKNTVRLAILFAILAILLICYMTFGIPLVVVAAFGIGLLLIIVKLFKSIKSKKRKKAIINVLLIFFLICGIATIIAFTLFLGYIKSVADPLFEKTNLNTKEMTILYDQNGIEFARLGSEKREKVTYEKLPEVLIDAIIAVEDSRYFLHNGFDAPRFVKASMGQALGNSNAGGASTLSMQVVKNSFTDADVNTGVAGIVRKFEDIYLAVFKLEKNYSKEEILEFYVNNHFLGGNVYGVQEASQAYFGKNVEQLNLSEAALLAGMFKSPNAYRPTTNPEQAAQRRETVLKLMLKHGYITKEEYEEANSIPIQSLVNPRVEESTSEYQGYIDTVVSEVKEKYNVNAYTTSLKIYTNLDRGKQDAVNRVFNGQSVYYTWPDEHLQSGVAVLNTQNGAILAIGAGRNRTGINSFNFATQINRQPGSTAKPLFDYGPAIEYNNASTYGFNDNGKYKTVLDAPYSYTGGKSISNWDNSYKGALTFRQALALSRNIPALKVFQSVDRSKIIEFVTNLGIKPEIENGSLHEAHSIGAFTGVSPLEMVAAYSAFGNGGYYNEPYAVSKIVYRSTGKEEVHQENKKQAMSDSTAYMISSILQDVQLNGSLGGSLPGIARKTGTTNYDDATVAKYGMAGDAIRDSWCIGYSTQTAMSMWYGYDKISSEYYMHNVRASIDKDKLFRALVAEGVFEPNRQGFAMPGSVVKVGNEYYKKGTQPARDPGAGPTPIAAPGGFKATFDEATSRVTLTWGAVGPGENADESLGAWGYSVYQGGTLLTWTDKTSYSFTTTNPYATYRVIAHYNGYDGIRSAEASYTLAKPKEPDPPEPDPDPEENTP